MSAKEVTKAFFNGQDPTLWPLYLGVIALLVFWSWTFGWVASELAGATNGEISAVLWGVIGLILVLTVAMFEPGIESAYYKWRGMEDLEP